ncbi:MAG: alpha/beta fold hydrolase [Gaiellaceae bacterium]
MPLGSRGLPRARRTELLLLGEESPDWAREGTDRVRVLLPDARVAILRGQGHAAIMTAPELVAEEVARFLRE